MGVVAIRDKRLLTASVRELVFRSPRLEPIVAAVAYVSV